MGVMCGARQRWCRSEGLGITALASIIAEVVTLSAAPVLRRTDHEATENKATKTTMNITAIIPEVL
jgi:hypothetical protein